MKFCVMVHDMTYVVIVTIWGLAHVYKIDLNPVQEFGLYNWLKGSFDSVWGGLLTGWTGRTEFFYVTSCHSIILPLYSC